MADGGQAPTAAASEAEAARSRGDDATPRSGRRSSLALTLTVVAALGLWVWLCWPLAIGSETLHFRDVFHSHHPLKAFGAAELRTGRIPATNPTWGSGQPFRGNPNAVAFYPGNLLYLVLPFWPAFNLHYALHWLLAAFVMARLARRLGQSREAAVLAALAYAGSGFLLSVLTFYNILVVVAWWPLVMLGVVRGDRRGLAAGGLACGLALLGGEPITAALGLVPLLVLAIARLGPVRAVLRVALVGSCGLLLALPQLVASLRVLPYTFRGGQGLLASQAAFYSLEPERLLELLVPFPFGIPGYFGPRGLEASGALEHLPFFYSLHVGVVALALAVVGWRRNRPLVAVVLAGLLLAWLGGLSGERLVAATFGLFRTPEKLLFWFALLLPLLAGAGLDCLRRGSTVAVRALGVVAGLLLAGALGDLLTSERTAVLGLRLQGLVLGSLLLVLAALAIRRRQLELLLPLQFVALLPLLPLFTTDAVEPYRTLPDWRGGVAPGVAVIAVRQTYPPWRTERPERSYPPGPHWINERVEAAELSPAPGVMHGLSYPTAPDLDGMHHQFTLLMLFRLSQGSWEERAAWARVLGADLLVSPEPVPTSLSALELIERRNHFGADVWLYRVEEAAPPAWWPQSVAVAASPGEAFSRVASAPSPTAVAVAPQPLEHAAGGEVRVLSAEPDRIELEVRGEGGLVVVRRAFQTVWRAHASGRELVVLPANLSLLGVMVPPGEHRVELSISSRPEWWGATVAGITALILLGLVAVGGRDGGGGGSEARPRAGPGQPD